MSSSWVVMTLYFTKDGKIDFTASEIAGYTAMILSLSAVFLGVRYERDKIRNGLITFKEAFMRGLGIVLVASLIYTIGWAIYYPNFMPDFPTQYMDCQVQKYQESGLSPEVIEVKKADLQNWMKLYENPFVMLGMTFLEIFPIGLVVALISALILKKKAHPENQTPQS